MTQPDALMQPSDFDAERKVIGACLLSKDATTKAMTALNPDDFYCVPYAHAFTAICQMAMAGEPVNVQTVIRKLDDIKTADGKESLLNSMGGGALVVNTVEGTLPEECEFWAKTVKKKRAERDLLQFGDWVRQQALSNPTDIDKLRASVEERLTNVVGGEAVKDVVKMDDGMGDLESRIDRYINDPDSITGLEMGWPVLDRMLDGLQPGNVTILYAPSSRFKSLFATNVGWRLARNGYPGMWYTTEMPKVQVQERILQLEAKMNFSWLRKDGTIGGYRDEIRAAMRRMAGYPIYLCDRSDVEVGALRAEVMRYKKWHNIQYVIVDLVDMVSTSAYKDDSVAQQSAVMRQMKALAKQADVHILLVSHVSKGDKALRNKPDLDVEDMKGSSSKYQDVDCAISLMPVERSPETGEWMGLTRVQITDAIASRKPLKLLVAVTKNRHGELARLEFAISLGYGGRITPMVNSSGQYVQQSMPETESEPEQAEWTPPVEIPDDDEYAPIDGAVDEEPSTQEDAA